MSEVIVMLTLQFEAGTAPQVLEQMIPAIHLTRAEAGNIQFELFQVAGNPDRYVVLERWQDQASLESHWAQPYTRATLDLFARHLVRPLSETDDVTHLVDVMATRDDARSAVVAP